MKEDGTHKGILLGNFPDDILDLIDKTLKFTDSTNYIYTKLFNLDIEVDTTGKKQPTSTTSMVKLKTKKRKLKVSKKTGKLIKENEKALKEYIDIMRCIPSIAKINSIDSIDKLCNNEFEWEQWIPISKVLFLKNYNNIEVFREQVDALFRNLTDEEEDFHRDRLDEYCKYI